MSVNGRLASLLLLALAISGVACGSASLNKTDGGAGKSGAGGAGGRAGAAGTGAGGATASAGGSGGVAAGSRCVLDSTQVDNCIIQ
jgi:hypothetical protein